jgi:hypothetical protein
VAEIGCVGCDGEDVPLLFFTVGARDQEFFADSHGSLLDVFGAILHEGFGGLVLEQIAAFRMVHL